MHIMEGYLDPIWCAVWFILAIPFIVLGARAIVKLMREHPEQKMTVALSGAFIFLLSSLKLPPRRVRAPIPQEPASLPSCTV